MKHSDYVMTHSCRFTATFIKILTNGHSWNKTHVKCSNSAVLGYYFVFCSTSDDSYLVIGKC